MKTILWIDDEIDLLQPYSIYLRDKGYEVVGCNNGRDAIDMAATQYFDVVFVDENMPGLSGLETLSEIKEMHPAWPVVMITKSEEENLMEMAIGQKIADYLTKPVNPSQILMSLKRIFDEKAILVEQVNANYMQEFKDISYMIDTACKMSDFVAVMKMLSRWELTLQDLSPEMHELLQGQRQQANAAFTKFITKNYQNWFSSTDRPVMSQDVMKTCVLPHLDRDEQVVFILIDNFRYDQWKTIEPILSEYFTIDGEQLYCTILPTATGYARNAIFSGLTPLQISEMYPDLWVEEADEEGMNLHEEELLQAFFQRYRRNYRFNYFKILESEFLEKNIKRIRTSNMPLQVLVVNFIDMLSHSRTDSKMMRELANDESAYRSLTLSWFQHSPMRVLFEQLAQKKCKVVLTTDHGTIRITNPLQILGDKQTNTNLRFKEGKALVYSDKNIFAIKEPKKVGLPCPNVSTSYVFATGNDFFSYPNNFNYYASYYRDTFQHGGVSLEEMLVPIVTLSHKR